MLAAACGDALGWPIEPRGNRVGGTRSVEPQFAFQSWTRREGGRYAPHQREIPAGTYSDDTQLMLAVARSLTLGESWLQHWTGTELPVWTVYELGGGGAVKRAAQRWAKGTPPWEDKAADRRKYFAAGANGTVMRVLPHAIYGAGDDNFDQVARRIVADGVSTHGHPRALVGALVAGYAQWRALRWDGKVGYGDLIDDCIAACDVWSSFRDPAEASGWLESANNEAGGAYEDQWTRTVEEMLGLLDVCQDAISRGSLARDSQVLTELGLYDREGGAGTRTAAAALYFASRYVARPPAGLIAAAFARRTDADTVASVTGALLGALTGPDWIEPLARDLQDSRYIRSLSEGLADPSEAELKPAQEGSQAKRRLLEDLKLLDVGGRLPLPVFLEGIVRRIEHPTTQSANEITIWWLDTRIDQRLAITHVAKLRDGSLRGAKQADRSAGDGASLLEQMPLEQAPVDNGSLTRAQSHWMTFQVRDIDRSTKLYHEVLGLTLRRRTAGYAVLGTNLVLEQASTKLPASADSELAGSPLSLDAVPVLGIMLRSPGLTRTRDRLIAAGMAVSPIGPVGDGRRFFVADPDGNVIDVRAASDQ